MKLIVRISLGLGVAALILWLFLQSSSSSHQQRPIVSASQTRPLPNSNVVHADTKISVPTLSPENAQAEGMTANLKTYLISQHPAAIESRLEKRDSFLSRYRVLGQKKVLLTPEETKELKGLLEDSDRRSFYKVYLQGVDFSAHAAADEQMYRLFVLQYLESSWRSKKLPDTIEFFVEFVLQDNFYADLSTEIKKSLAYEKIKVLDFLKQESPASLEVIRQRMPGLRHEKLLRNYFDQLSEPPSSHALSPDAQLN